MDSLLFAEGFNKCNYKILDQILADDLEFYHDKGGIKNKKEFIDATRNNICNSPNGKITREVVKGSTEVYPLEKNGKIYGFLQNGLHEFYIQEPGKKLYKTGRAKFSCLWLLATNGSWKLKRVFSYDHQASE
ncbi:nuclear transport factor 2 family protein [Flavobacterium sp. Sd200]|uniref:nuclear transport factor 2 family protein n=1 Tax=Flavobacterium sp. Sd200 TaxID=2692211 RepID=UPI001F3642C7|nr:nuclear transport factor 2 family protein [Flavobacterium sp. Sd200]